MTLIIAPAGYVKSTLIICERANMEETLNTAVSLAIQLTIIVTMWSMGLRVTASQIFAALSKSRLMAKALLANLILVPFIAYFLLRLLDLPETNAVGILVMVAAPGAPLIPKYVEIAKGDLPFSVGLTFVLSVLSIFTAPLTINLFLSGGYNFDIDVLGIVITLVIVQLLPLLLGMGVKWQSPALVDKLLRPSVLLATLLLILVIVLVLVRDLRSLGDLPLSTLVVMIIMTITMLALGWTLGGPDSISRKSLALGTSAQSSGLALLITIANFPASALTIVAFGLLNIFINVSISVFWNR